MVASESFGPLAPIIPIDDLDDAIDYYNEWALRALVGDRHAQPGCGPHSRAATKCGTTNVNEVPGYRIESSPFGGIKDSGLGIKEGVIEAMKFMTTVKTFSLPWARFYGFPIRGKRIRKPPVNTGRSHERTDDENPYLLLTPGPLSTSLTVRQAMLRDWCTWDKDYNEGIVQVIRAKLVDLATDADDRHQRYTSVLMQGSGTFCVESMLGSTIPADGKLLVLANGAYGQRIAKIAQVAKIPVRSSMTAAKSTIPTCGGWTMSWSVMPVDHSRGNGPRRDDDGNVESDRGCWKHREGARS